MVMHHAITLFKSKHSMVAYWAFNFTQFIAAHPVHIFRLEENSLKLF